MPSVFILHGIYGDPDENWFPWLKKELENKGMEVFVPHLPTHEPLLPEHWWEAFREYEDKIKDDSIIIGHSLGVAFALKIIEKHPTQAAYLISSAWGVTGNEFDPVMGAVANQDFDWGKIKENCKNFTIYHSDNDPYLKLERAETLAKHLETEVNLIEGAGHFNTKSGYTEFPELLAEF